MQKCLNGGVGGVFLFVWGEGGGGGGGGGVGFASQRFKLLLFLNKK